VPPSTAGFDSALKACLDAKMPIRYRVFDFKAISCEQTPSAAQHVKFQVTHEPGKSTGVCLRMPKGMVLPAGSLLGFITGDIVLPSTNASVANPGFTWYAWDLAHLSAFGPPRSRREHPVLDGSRNTTVASLINSPTPLQQHNCCAISHRERTSMLLYTCTDLSDMDVLLLSYCKKGINATCMDPVNYLVDVQDHPGLCISADARLYAYDDAVGAPLSNSQAAKYLIRDVFPDTAEARLLGPNWRGPGRCCSAQVWLRDPMRCFYQVTLFGSGETETPVETMFYSPARGELLVRAASSNVVMRIPIQHVDRPAASKLFVNLHRWKRQLEQLALTDVPPMTGAS
jgi:hypothetical protein